MMWISILSSRDLGLKIDLIASLRSLAANEHTHDGMLKLPADLDRYKWIIETTKPEVIVETGTWTGGSARWFREQGPDVISIDVTPPSSVDGVTLIRGDSAAESTALRTAVLVGGRRCMVSLDSVHNADHVAREIDLYGPLVTLGCYLVVEDGIFGYAPTNLRARHGLADLTDSPLDAIADKLIGNPDWERDTAIEAVSPTSHHPAGFWKRV